MENIGDYFYLIVFAAVIFFNLFKKKKPEEKKAPPVITQEQKLEEFLKKYTEETEQKQEPEWREEPPIVAPRHTNAVKTPYTGYKSVKRPKSNLQELSVEEEVAFQLDFEDPEELKKGIVFSEIFNRKY